MTTAIKKNVEPKIAVLDGPEWNSSDDDDDDDDEPEPTEKKVVHKKPIRNKSNKNDRVDSKTKEEEGSNVIYLGHIPANFEEPELRGFLGQFGNVTRLKLIRARKTANPRGFGFVEFDDEEVAHIVADTMSGYLMGQKRLVCHVLPKDKIHPNLFKGADKVFKKVDWAGIHRGIVNRPKPAEKMKEITKRLMSRERKRREKLNEMGIDYDFPGYVASNEAFPVLMDAPKQKRVLENVEEDKSEPPAKKGKVEKDEPSGKKLKVGKDEASVKKGKFEKSESLVKQGKVGKAEPPVKKGNVEKNEAAVKKVKNDEPSVKKGKVEKNDPPVKKGRVEQNEPPSKKGKVEKNEQPPSKGVKVDKIIVPNVKGKNEKVDASVKIAKVEKAEQPLKKGKVDTQKSEPPTKKVRARSEPPKKEKETPTPEPKSEVSNKRKDRLSLDASVDPSSAKKGNQKQKRSKGRKSV